MDTALPLLRPESKAKHVILQNYLNAWLPIMTSWNTRIVYVDGFAGPGRYRGGEDGSPVIFVKAVTNHCLRLGGEVVGLFIERHPATYATLKETMDALPTPAGIRLRVDAVQGEFEPVVEALFKSLESAGRRLAPPFFFIDPFGYSQVPMELLGRIMKERGAEMFINFMYSFITRFIGVAEQEANFDRLFGCEDWRQFRTVGDTEERRDGLRSLYRRQLLNATGAKYVRSFEVRRGGGTRYFLFFATKHLKGFDVMKQAMRRADPSGTFTFSDVTDPGQRVLFEPEIDTGPLREMLLRSFGGRSVGVEELDRFVVESDQYVTSDLRRRTLVAMEKEGLIAVDETTRKRRSTYPSGTRISFG